MSSANNPKANLTPMQMGRLSTTSSTSTSSAVEWRVARRPQDFPRPSMRLQQRRITQNRDFVKLANILPPMFVCWIVGTVMAVYVGFHLFPLLQVQFPVAARNPQDHHRGVHELLVSQVLTTLLLVSYARAVLTFPGTVPDGSEWKLGYHDPRETSTGEPLTREVKITGERRHCKWCLRYKPDRCHHCRVCGICILKMDHHCPWIMNCVGFGNHKYFFLLVFYSVITCYYIATTMWGTVLRSAEQERSTKRTRR